MRRTTSSMRAAIFVARSDIEKRQLIGARGVIGDCRFHRIAGITQIDEIDALTTRPSLHVETGNDADLETS